MSYIFGVVQTIPLIAPSDKICKHVTLVVRVQKFESMLARISLLETNKSFVGRCFCCTLPQARAEVQNIFDTNLTRMPSKAGAYDIQSNCRSIITLGKYYFMAEACRSHPVWDPLCIKSVSFASVGHIAAWFQPPLVVKFV